MYGVGIVLFVFVYCWTYYTLKGLVGRSRSYVYFTTYIEICLHITHDISKLSEYITKSKAHKIDVRSHIHTIYVFTTYTVNMYITCHICICHMYTAKSSHKSTYHPSRWDDGYLLPGMKNLVDLLPKRS